MRGGKSSSLLDCSKMKKISYILLSLIMSFTLITNVSAYSRDENKEVKSIVSKLILSYALNESKDYLDDLKNVSEDDYEIWNDVINYWDYIENDMTLNTTVPNDLPTENHVFIVLGYALNEDGTIEDELVGRLQVALDTIQKYPHNYILVTGGVEQNGWSEGKRMYDWLVEHGVSQNQIIVEEQAKDTAGNASNSFEMLYTDYTNIKSCSLISSSYHIKRGSLLYYAESLLKAKELGVNPIEFIGEGNVGWEREDKDSESMIVKAISLCGIAHCMSQVKTMALSLVAFMFIFVLMLFLIIRRLRTRKNSID